MRWPLVLGSVVGLSVLWTQAAASATIRVEAETITASYNIDGRPIEVRSCSAAYGGLAVDGLDVVGEWMQMPLELTEGICFVDSLRSAGYVGAIRTFAIHFEKLSPAGLWAADTVTTIPGTGIT